MKVDTWIERTLEKLPFVEWDRYIENTCPEGTYISVYGWIDRDADEYKDFVLLEFLLWSRDARFIISSSAEYSEKIHEIMHPDEDGHADCNRIEDRFDVEDAIILQQKLG